MGDVSQAGRRGNWKWEIKPPPPRLPPSSMQPALTSPSFTYLGLSRSSAFKKLPTLWLEELIFGYACPGLFARHP